MKANNEKQIRIFCENLRKLRKATGLSLADMAQRLQIGRSTLSSLERGILPPRLSCTILFRIQHEFHIEPKDMFQEKTQNYFNIFSKTP
ncbi:MAG: helix-turn-helix transcriptional regulator [Clostridia bacterium]|nr:helix-turn-helix transcriptional regulator [Clostridia bacterium]